MFRLEFVKDMPAVLGLPPQGHIVTKVCQLSDGEPYTPTHLVLKPLVGNQGGVGLTRRSTSTFATTLID